jgi:hypothetical protein
MSFEKKVEITEKLFAADFYWVVFISKFQLTAAGIRLQDCENDRGVCERKGFASTGLEMARLIFNMHHINKKSYLGVYKCDTISSFFCNADEQELNRVDEIVEYIYDTDQRLIGWRFFFIINDPSFKFERGLQTYWVIESKKRSKPKRLNLVKSEFEVYRDNKAWITEGISPYLNEKFYRGDEGRKACRMNIEDDYNPANICSCLTFDKTCDIILMTHPNVDPIYLNKGGYIHATTRENGIDGMVMAPHSMFAVEIPDGPDGPDGFMETEAEEIEVGETEGEEVEYHRILFPRGGYVISHWHEDPMLILSLPLSMEPTFDENSITESSKQRTLTFHDEQNNEELYKEAIRRNPDGKYDYLTAFCRKFTFIPGSQIVHKYYDDLISKQGFKFEPIIHAMDPTLSEFGNMITRQLYRFEIHSDISVFHSELLLLLLVSLSSCDALISKPRFHTIFSGPPDSGKSYFSGKLFSTFCIPKLIHSISVQTARSNTTNSNLNGKIIVLDELGPRFTEKGDGQGNADIKEILTKGELTTEMCGVDKDTHDRVMHVTVTYQYCSVISNTNLARGELIEPIASRFLVKQTPIIKRPHLNMMSKSDNVYENPILKLKQEAHILEWRMMQVIACQYYMAKHIGIMPAVYMNWVKRASQIVFAYLEEKCFVTVPSRDIARIMMMCENVTLFYAIQKVFFTTGVIPNLDQYKEEYLEKLKPYLFCKMEHFYFALSLMHDCVANPNIKVILEAIHKIINECEGDDKYAASLQFGGAVNTDYYVIQISNAMDIHDIATSVSKRIHYALSSNTTKQVIADASIKDVLEWLCNQTCYGNKRVASFRRGGPKQGLEIAVSYIESQINRRHPIIEAIEHSMTVHNQRIVLGMTYKEGIESELLLPGNPLPHIFQVVTNNPSNEQVLIENKWIPDYADEYLYGGGDGELPDPSLVPSGFTPFTAEMETEEHQEWCMKQDGELVDCTFDGGMNYPDDLIIAHGRKYDCLKLSTTQPTRTINHDDGQTTTTTTQDTTRRTRRSVPYLNSTT